MIAEITPPPLEAHARRSLLWRGLVAYVMSMVATTTLVGLVAGSIGGIVTHNIGDFRLWIAVLAMTSLVYGFHEGAILRLPLPQSAWQVPVQWARHGKVGQMLLYGSALGAELLTFMPYATFYVLVFLEAVLGLEAGTALGMLYGIARITPTVVGVIASYRRQGIDPIVDAIMNSRNRYHMLNGVALSIAGEVLIVTLFLVS